MSDRDPCRSPGRRRTSETSSVSACEALSASDGSRDLTQRAAKFLPDSFQSVSICFKMFHICCFALPARVNFNCYLQDCDCTLHNAADDKQLVVSGCSGWHPKVCRLPKFPLCDSAVSFRPGQTRAHKNCLA